MDQHFCTFVVNTAHGMVELLSMVTMNGEKFTKMSILGILDHFWPFMVTIEITSFMSIGCLLQNHQKCITVQKTRGQNVDPINSYSPNTYFGPF